MGRLGNAVADMKARGEKAFVPYITSGDPNLARTRELWHALDRAGADIIEIGIPFSDPLADGPTIQRASLRALDSGTTLAKTLSALAEERPSIEAKTVIFTYYNPILSLGIEEFARIASDAGVDGTLVPDLIPEESDPLRDALSAVDIDVVSLVAPTTGDERLKYIGEQSPALVYAVSLTGVTGARGALSADIEQFMERCRANIAAPIVVGFGISTGEHATRVASVADGVVVGSALVKIAEELGDSDELVARVEATARELAQATKSASH